VPDILEEALARAIRSAAESAPPYPADRAARMAGDSADHIARRAARGSRLTVAAAAAAVLIVATGGALAIDHIRSERPSRSGVPAAGGTRVDYRDGSFVQQIWPDALVTLPWNGNNDVSQYRGVFSNGQVLVGIKPDQHAFNSESAIAVWDTKRDSLRIVDGSQQIERKTAIVGVGNNDRWIVWASIDGTGSTTIWSAPAQGGHRRKIATIRVPRPSYGDDIGTIIVDGDQVVIAPVDPLTEAPTADILTVPATGGAPKIISGSRNYGIVRWPWVGTPTSSASTSPTPTKAAANTTVWNVKTGVRLSANVKGLSTPSCSVSWCVGTVGGKAVAQRRDGSGRSTIRGANAIPGEPIVADRFIEIRPKKGHAQEMYDLLAGRTVLISSPGQEDGGTHNSPGVAATMWTIITRIDDVHAKVVEKATSNYVLNFAKIR
jgi:hypothetical protein